VKRRGFLASLGLLLAAPAVVRAESLMKLVTPRLILWGDGVHDDTAALQALMDGKSVVSSHNAIRVDKFVSVQGGLYRLTAPIHIRGGDDDHYHFGGATLIAGRGHPGPILKIERGDCRIVRTTFQPLSRRAQPHTQGDTP